MDEETVAPEQHQAAHAEEEDEAAMIWRGSPRQLSAPPEATGLDYTEAHLAQIWQQGGAPESMLPQEVPPQHPPSRRWPRVLMGLLGIAVVGGGAVSAFALAGRAPTPSSAPSRAPSPSATRPMVLAPEQLAAEPEAFAVTLTWMQPLGGAEVETYDVFRDGQLVGSVDGPATTYTDTGVVPGTAYAYGVAARVSDFASLRALVQVETPVPPLKDARVEGTFNVKFRASAQTGFQSYTGSFNRGWVFKPTCDAAACDIRWTDVDTKSLKATLDRRGDTYRGEDSGDFNSVCGASPVTSDLAIVFHVTKAKVIDGAWRATRLVGTVEETEAAQLGCVS